jgi:hypothetical protein
MKIVVLAGLLALCATPALAAGKLPDGTYDCTLDNGYIAGSIEIDGMTYKGPAFDGNYEGAYPFEVGDDYGLFLKGPVGGYTDPGYQFIGALVVKNGDEPAIELHVKQDGSDNVHFVTCTLRH